MGKYVVYGLESFARCDDATRWAERYTRRDLGGYESVEVISFWDNEAHDE